MADAVIGYSTNCHAGDSFEELIESLSTEVTEVRRHLGGSEPVGLALRISRQAAKQVAAKPELIEKLRDALSSAGARAVAANAFPIATPEKGVYKDGIYRPDWRDPERCEATLQIARALAALLDVGARGVLSTLTGTYRPWPGADSPEAERDAAAGLRACAEGLERISEETGRDMVLALEPEPFTTADSLPETLRYFHEHVFAGGAEKVARRRLGVNVDLCHAAVMFEDAAENMRASAREGINVFGLHVSAALRSADPAGERDAFRAFDEPVYLHQVSATGEDGQVAFRSADLGEFLSLPEKELQRLAEVRAHFHVPIFAERVGGLTTTSDLTRAAVRAARAENLTDLFIVETYTWKQLEGMPGAAASTAEGLARELVAAREMLAGG